MGDCFQANSNYLIMHEKRSWKLCHGIVINQKDKRPMIHCWLEFDISFEGVGIPMRMVKDVSNGNDIEIPQEIYYRLGKIKEVKKYTYKQATKWMLQTGVYGPWELQCER